MHATRGKHAGHQHIMPGSFRAVGGSSQVTMGWIQEAKGHQQVR